MACTVIVYSIVVQFGFTEMAELLGKWIRLISQIGEHVIPIRQPEAEGVSNQRESLIYKVYQFKVEDSDQVIPVFVQHNLSADNYRMVSVLVVMG